MPTIRIKSTDEATQGPFVIIDAEQFNEDVHERFDPDPVEPLDTAPEPVAKNRSASSTKRTNKQG
jgi:hypothetical protein